MAYLIEGEHGKQVLVVLPNESLYVQSSERGRGRITHEIRSTKRKKLIMCGID